MRDSQYKNRYNRLVYDRLSIFVPKGSRYLIRREAASQGLSLNSYIVRMIPRHLINRRENEATKTTE